MPINKNLLPSPHDYLAREGLQAKGGGLWRTTHCVFHDDKRASLSINVENGAFKCHACGAKGGDLLDFHMLRFGLRFKDAAKSLGAWEADYERRA